MPVMAAATTTSSGAMEQIGHYLNSRTSSSTLTSHLKVLNNNPPYGIQRPIPTPRAAPERTSPSTYWQGLSTGTEDPAAAEKPIYPVAVVRPGNGGTEGNSRNGFDLLGSLGNGQVDHQHHRGAGGPGRVHQADEEEWTTKKRVETRTTKNIERRVQKQIVLEDGRILSEDDPEVTVDTVEDVESHSEDGDEGRELVQRAGLPPGGSGGPSSGGGRVLREALKRNTFTRNVEQKSLTTAGATNLGEISSRDVKRVVEGGRDPRSLIKSYSDLDDDNTNKVMMPSIGGAVIAPKVVHKGRTVKRTVDQEDILEVDRLTREGKVETERRVTRESVQDDGLETPDSNPSSSSGEESSHDGDRNAFSRRKEERFVDYYQVPKGKPSGSLEGAQFVRHGLHLTSYDKSDDSSRRDLRNSKQLQQLQQQQRGHSRMVDNSSDSTRGTTPPPGPPDGHHHHHVQRHHQRHRDHQGWWARSHPKPPKTPAPAPAVNGTVTSGAAAPAPTIRRIKRYSSSERESPPGHHYGPVRPQRQGQASPRTLTPGPRTSPSGDGGPGRFTVHHSSRKFHTIERGGGTSDGVGGLQSHQGRKQPQHHQHQQHHHQLLPVSRRETVRGLKTHLRGTRSSDNNSEDNSSSYNNQYHSDGAQGHHGPRPPRRPGGGTLGPPGRGTRSRSLSRPAAARGTGGSSHIGASDRQQQQQQPPSHHRSLATIPRPAGTGPPARDWNPSSLKRTKSLSNQDDLQWRQQQQHLKPQLSSSGNNRPGKNSIFSSMKSLYAAFAKSVHAPGYYQHDFGHQPVQYRSHQGGLDHRSSIDNEDEVDDVGHHPSASRVKAANKAWFDDGPGPSTLAGPIRPPRKAKSTLSGADRSTRSPYRSGTKSMDGGTLPGGPRRSSGPRATPPGDNLLTQGQRRWQVYSGGTGSRSAAPLTAPPPPPPTGPRPIGHQKQVLNQQQQQQQQSGGNGILQQQYSTVKKLFRKGLVGSSSDDKASSSYSTVKPNQGQGQGQQQQQGQRPEQGQRLERRRTMSSYDFNRDPPRFEEERQLRQRGQVKSRFFGQRDDEDEDNQAGYNGSYDYDYGYPGGYDSGHDGSRGARTAGSSQPRPPPDMRRHLLHNLNESRTRSIGRDLDKLRR